MQTRPTCRPDATSWLKLAASLALLAAPLAQAIAGNSPLPVTVGAGLRTSFVDTRSSGSTPRKSDDFNLDSVRLYISGSINSHIKFMFNTEYKGSPPTGTNSVQVLDAVAEFSDSPKLNIWAGRFLPPSDRANLYGPYYANQWNVYDDGVQDGYPSVVDGRDNGVAYWGQFGILKVSAGVFDIPSTTGTSNVVYAGRLQLDFWDPEPGYYLNGTYYGKKNILAVGVADQSESSHDSYSGDFLLERNLGTAGAVTFESEYAKYNHFGGYDPKAQESSGYYVLASYLLPQKIGIGRLEPLIKYAHATYNFTVASRDDTQKTRDFELGYIIRGFNARVSLFYQDVTYAREIAGKSYREVGLGVQLQI